MHMAAALKSAKQEFLVPTLSEASPQYAELAQRKRDLLAQKVTIEADISRTSKALRAPAAPRINAEVARLIGDEVPSDGSYPSRQRLGELQQQLRELNAAIAIIESRLGIERGKTSMLICDQVRDEHRRRARDVCFKLLELREAMLAYTELADALNEREIAWGSLSPSQLLALGHPLDPQSRTAIYLRSMVSHGFLDTNEVPAKIR
ncbi:hypothetical protein BE61_56560 [Bradyrhizobium elkanii USDA 61]|nr:hypothetical protein BE61_56560 [Bradyrhizobium elkanii USDA 61]